MELWRGRFQNGGEVQPRSAASLMNVEQNPNANSTVKTMTRVVDTRMLRLNRARLLHHYQKRRHLAWGRRHRRRLDIKDRLYVRERAAPSSQEYLRQ